MAVHTVANPVSATRRNFGERIKDATTIFDVRRRDGIRRPGHFCEWYPVILNTLRRLMIDQRWIIGNFAGADREGPVVARSVFPCRNSIEIQQDAILKRDQTAG